MTLHDALGRTVYMSVNSSNEITLSIPDIAVIRLPHDQFRILVGLVTKALIANQMKEAK